MTFDWPRRVVAAAIAVLAVGDVAALAVIEQPDRGRGEQAVTSTSVARVAPPKAWDPRVAELAAYVEKERGLAYKHPVAVAFLPEAKYREEVGVEQDGDLSAQEKQDIATFEGQARALGLLPKATSLLDATSAIVDEGTLAFYDPDKPRMVIRGTDITVGVRVTVVHELTHALQDQHFDLTRTFDSDGAGQLYHALVEGDAVRVERAYVQTQLKAADQRKYLAEQQRVQESVDLSAVPPALVQLFGAPYALGAPMTAIVVEERGQDGLNALFRRPPESDEGMLNPFALLDGEKRRRVATPKLKPGEKRTDKGDFGALSLYVVLASFIDSRTALHAVDGWAGDAYVGYRKNGLSCLRADFRSDTPTDADQLTAALNQWRQPFPPDRVTVTRTTAGVELDACEPDVVPKPRREADSAIALPAARMEIVGQALKQGAPVDAARCFATEFVKRVDLGSLTAGSEADEATFTRLGLAIAAKCGPR